MRVLDPNKVGISNKGSMQNSKVPPGAVVTLSRGNDPDNQPDGAEEQPAKSARPPDPIRRKLVPVRDDDTLSLPLYLSGLVVALAGVLAIDAEVGSPQFSATTILLTVLGFVFSYAYRWMRIDGRYLHYFAGVLALALAYGYFTQNFNLMALMPSGVALPSDLMMAVFLEWLVVVRSWMLLGDGEVAFSAVISVSIIGLVSVYDISVSVVTDFLVYVVAAVFLLLHQQYLAQKAWSGLRERSRPAGRAIRAQLLIAALCGVMVLLLGTVVVVPVAAVGSHLSLGGALRTLMSVYKNDKNDSDSSQGSVAFSDDPDFSIGTGDVQGGDDTTVLLHVVSNDHQPRYWRGRTYDRYMGNAWVSSLTSPLPAISGASSDFQMNRSMGIPGMQVTLDNAGELGGPAALPPGPRTGNWYPLVTSLVRVADGHTHTLYAPIYPRQVTMPMLRQYTFTESQDGELTADEIPSGFMYFVSSYGGSPSIATLRTCKLGNCPADIRDTFVDQTGDNVDATDRRRLVDTAQSIVSSLPVAHRDEYDLAEAIRKWVSQRCMYSLSVSAVPTGDDAVSYFLFTSRKGYCDLFASSMAILCRYAGIPARVVTGFDQGVPASNGGYDLRAMDKHAWVEVFFPGQGWYPFDPTAGAATDNSSQSAQQSLTRSIWNTAVSWIQKEFNINGPIPLVLFLVILISLAFVLKSEVIDPFFTRLQSRAQEQRLALSGLSSAEQAGQAWEWVRIANNSRYRKMERLLSQAGVGRLPHRTPREYEVDLQTELPKVFAQRDSNGTELAQDALLAVAALTEDFTLSRYAPRADVAERLLDREKERVGENALSALQSITRRVRLMHSIRWLFGRNRRVPETPSATVSAAP